MRKNPGRKILIAALLPLLVSVLHLNAAFGADATTAPMTNRLEPSNTGWVMIKASRCVPGTKRGQAGTECQDPTTKASELAAPARTVVNYGIDSYTIDWARPEDWGAFIAKAEAGQGLRK